MSRAAAVLVAVLLALVTTAAPVQADPKSFCMPQVQRVLAVRAEIEAHNARPHVFQLPRQQAALSAYNANKIRLDAAQTAARAAALNCLEAMQKLAAEEPGGPTLRTPTPDRVKKIGDAVKNLPPGWKMPNRPGRDQSWPGPDKVKDPKGRALYDALRRDNPGNIGAVKLRGEQRPRVGDPDPAYPGATIKANPRGGGPWVAADHIIPLTEIMRLPGFLRLNPRNMYAVTQAPVNYQWLSWSANSAKQARSVRWVKGADKTWRNDQVALQNEVRTLLIDMIRKLLASQ